MSAMISAIDAYSVLPNMKIGENGSTELAWSTDISERIVQFDFQCVRTDAAGVEKLETVLNALLYELSKRKWTSEAEAKRKEMLVNLFKIIGKTRDINGGKGEYTLSYMMIWTWFKYFPDATMKAFSLFFIEPNRVDIAFNNQEPYGSWKDIKYMCAYAIGKGAFKDHPLVIFCVEQINKQLKMDSDLYDSKEEDVNKNISLAAKWISRESSNKFGFLYQMLATGYFPEYINSAKSDTSKMAAIKKCKAQYRMLCSKLNRHLDTIQIKQTSGKWSEIDHSKTTSLTMMKQRAVLMNRPIKNNGDSFMRSEDPDRIQCAKNLTEYLENLKRTGNEVKGKNVGLEAFTSQARTLLMNHSSQQEFDVLNSQWRDNSNKKNSDVLGKMIAMVDMSGSMNGDPMNAAIALGCRVAEKSVLGKRVLTFSSEPSWINLESCETFTDMVKTINANTGSAGLSTNFYKALDVILKAIEHSKPDKAEVENMILAIFSDMQINTCISDNAGFGYDASPEKMEYALEGWGVMYEKIKTRYNELGMRVYGETLNPPHILFWNLRSTDGFPTMTTQNNTSMMSGFDPAVLNLFCELGYEGLKGLTPYSTLIKLLDNPRYYPLQFIARRMVV